MYEWILIVSLVIFIFLLDDLFIDVYSLLLRLGPKAVEVDDQTVRPDRPLAIMVANWKEQDVLESMVVANSHLLRDPNVHFFLGVYPNDLETKVIAEKLDRTYKNIHLVVNRSEGPTFKGQMINEIIRSIFKFEGDADTVFDGFIIHDAEDVISPHSIHLYRKGLQETHDFIQLPVLSLPLKLRNLVGGTYLDEFAESHSKDILVRQSLGVAIPSAGVGTCLSRKLVMTFCYDNNGVLFADKDLAEDYILGMLAHKKKLSSVFYCYYPKKDSKSRLVATREYFPSDFFASMRQKTRWTLGISLQGWKKLGWFGGLTQRYFLWRDRKTLFSSVLNPMSAVVLVYLAIWGMGPSLDEPFLATLLIANLVGVVLRLLLRLRWSYYHHGLAHALFVPVRWPVAIVINSLAGLSALMKYMHSSIYQTELAWSKTQHRFPMDLSFIEDDSPTPQKGQEMSV